MSLIHNANYFARYGFHLGEGRSARKAWEATERDLSEQTGGFRRFTNYHSFAVALSNYKRGELGKNVLLKFDKIK